MRKNLISSTFTPADAYDDSGNTEYTRHSRGSILNKISSKKP